MPNKGVELTAYSVRSCVAPASSRSSRLVFDSVFDSSGVRIGHPVNNDLVGGDVYTIHQQSESPYPLPRGRRRTTAGAATRLHEQPGGMVSVWVYRQAAPRLPVYLTG